MSDEPESNDSDLDAISLPDIPMPQVAEDKTIKDEFTGAMKFCFIGSGQGGSRIAETFWDIGYRRVCAVNSTSRDLNPVKLPDKRKLVIGDSQDKGAGKDMVLGKQYAKQSREKILDLMRRSFDVEFDRIIITIGAGGGTGAGSAEVLVEIAREWAESCDVAKADGPPKVGVILALPQRSEGVKPSKNAVDLLSRMFNLQIKNLISPLVIIDNQRIDEVYPDVSVDKFWSTANQSICSLFHLFNLVAAKDSQYVSFDRADYDDILSSGIVSFGATPMAKPKSSTDISAAIRQNLSNNILSGGFDIKQATKAGCVFLAGAQILGDVPQSWINHGFEMLTRMLGDDSVVHRGVYKSTKDELAAYMLIGGLPMPYERIVALRRDGHMNVASSEADDGVH